jgi:hypothetical protein
MNQEEEDVMSIINLLAGAAQAGSQGVLAQAAYNLIKATEAKQRATGMQANPEFLKRAEALVEETRKVFIELANNKKALEEGKQDIINYKAKPYSA